MRTRIESCARAVEKFEVMVADNDIWSLLAMHAIFAASCHDPACSTLFPDDLSQHWPSFPVHGFKIYSTGPNRTWILNLSKRLSSMYPPAPPLTLTP